MIAPNEVRLRTSNPWIAVRNPRPSICAGRGAYRGVATIEVADRISPVVTVHAERTKKIQKRA